MSNEIILPSDLKPLYTRDTKDWHKIMMERYNKMSEEYKNNDLCDFEKDTHIESTDNILTFEDADVFIFITKAKIEMAKIKKINNSIITQIEEYETFKDEIEKFNNIVKQAEKIYETLSKKIQITNIKNKLIISDNILLQNENKINIEEFEKNIDDKIFELNNKLNNNRNKILDFKKLILKCIGDEKFSYNMCNICVKNKINKCINPCGHTFCSSCLEKMGSKCGMCRSKIQSSIKMYIDNDDDNEIHDEDINSNEGIASANLIGDLNNETGIHAWQESQFTQSIASTAGFFYNGGIGW